MYKIIDRKDYGATWFFVINNIINYCFARIEQWLDMIPY